MVHALEEIQRLLKPDGILIYIHPFPEGTFIKVFQGGKLLFDEPKRLSDHEDVLAADEAVAQVVESGLYVIERSSKFDYLTYGSSVDELRAYWERYEAYNENSKDEEHLAREEKLYAQADEIMRAAGAGAEVATYERAGMARLRPVE